MKKHILVFGDSNTWGYDPTHSDPNCARFSDSVRWTGVLQRELGDEYTVITEGLPGRTSVLDNPFDECRNGKDQLVPLLASHAPLDLLVIMLGTNDLKAIFSASAQDIATGVGMLVDMALARKKEFVSKKAEILVICPHPLSTRAHDTFREMFAGGDEKSQELPVYFEKMANEKDVAWLNAGEYVDTTDGDGVHLVASQHEKLGVAVAARVKEILE